MFIAALLQYHCLIRPVELTRLRFKYFDLQKGVVNLPGDITKNGKPRRATIPKQSLHYLMELNFANYPTNYFVFGKGLNPHASVAVTDNVCYKWHDKYLKELKKAEKLNDTTGLTWYSWKDTGITDIGKKISPIGLKDQAGHESLDTTMIYYHQDEINIEIRDLDSDIL